MKPTERQKKIIEAKAAKAIKDAEDAEAAREKKERAKADVKAVKVAKEELNFTFTPEQVIFYIFYFAIFV